MPEIRVNCPDSVHVPRVGHPDRKRKLWINTTNNKGHCFRCNWSISNAQEFCDRYNIRLDFSSVYKSDPTVPSLKLPREYSTNWDTLDGQQAYAYLLSRGLTPAIIAGYEIGYCRGGPYDRMVLIPIYEKGTLVSFQARDYTDQRKPEDRWRTAGRDAGGIADPIFNLDRAQKTGLLVVVEGVFDAFRLPEYAIAIFGKLIAGARRRKILAAKPIVVLEALDRDGTAEEDADDFREEFSGLTRVARLPFAGKDLGSLPDDELQEVRALCKEIVRTLPHRPGRVQSGVPPD